MSKRTDLRDGTRPDSHVTVLRTFHIAKDDIYFLPYRLNMVIKTRNSLETNKAPLL